MLNTLLNLVTNKARKATGAFVATALGTGGTASLDGDLTRPEVIASLGAAAVAAAVVYGFRNQDA